MGHDRCAWPGGGAAQGPLPRTGGQDSAADTGTSGPCQLPTQWAALLIPQVGHCSQRRCCARGFWFTFDQLTCTLEQATDGNHRTPPGLANIEPADHLQDQKKISFRETEDHCCPEGPALGVLGSQPPGKAKPRQTLGIDAPEDAGPASGAASPDTPAGPILLPSPELPLQSLVGCADTRAGSTKRGWRQPPKCRGCPEQSLLGGAASVEDPLPHTQGRRHPLTQSWALGTKVHAEQPLQTNET